MSSPLPHLAMARLDSAIVVPSPQAPPNQRQWQTSWRPEQARLTARLHGASDQRSGPAAGHMRAPRPLHPLIRRRPYKEGAVRLYVHTSAASAQECLTTNTIISRLSPPRTALLLVKVLAVTLVEPKALLMAPPFCIQQRDTVDERDQPPPLVSLHLCRIAQRRRCARDC
jgi:hypothetical protein